MTTETQSFAGGDQNPWTSVPSGWSVLSGSFIRYAAYNGIHGNAFGQLVFNTYTAGLRTISSTMQHNGASYGSEWGLCALNPLSTGFSLLVTDTSIVLRKELAGSGGATIASISTANITDANFSMDFDDSTGEIVVKKNGSTVLTGSYTDTPSLKLGVQSYSGGIAQSFASVTIDYTPAQAVTSINGGSPITSSQSAVAAATTGFTGLPTTITTNATGLTCGTISGTTNSPTWVQTIRTDGAVFPKSGTVVTYTFTNGAETASGSQTINKDADQTAVIAASPVNDDPTYLFGAIYSVTGRSAANSDEVYHAIPSAMLTNGVDTILPADAIAPNGEMQFYNAGTFPCWVWTAATGVNYYYSVTITEGGSVVINGGLTTRGLIAAGLTARGLAAHGL